MKSDKYIDVTRKVLVREDLVSTASYHPSCNKSYTAVTRPKEPLSTDDESNAQEPCIKTRRCSVLPKSDQQGLLKGTCNFCGKSRKKRKGKEEPMLKVSTVADCESICQLVQS